MKFFLHKTKPVVFIKKVFHNQTVYSLLILTVAEQCQSNQNKGHNQGEIPDGGHCSYSVDTMKAMLIDTIPAGNDAMDLIFVCENYGSPDTFSFYQVENRYVTRVELKEYPVHLGRDYVMEEHHITSGSCNPDIRRITLHPYNPLERDQ